MLSIWNVGVKVLCVKQQFNYIVNIDKRKIVKISFNIADNVKREMLSQCYCGII